SSAHASRCHDVDPPPEPHSCPTRRSSDLREQNPDVVLLTPLIGVVESPQLDYLQSAKAIGIPTALCVWSWDHLSSKAIVRSVPRSEEHTSELQSRDHLVCRLLLEKKNNP